MNLTCGRSLAILPSTQLMILATKNSESPAAQITLISACRLVMYILGKRMRLEEARSLMQVSGALGLLRVETRPEISMSHFIHCYFSSFL